MPDPIAAGSVFRGEYQGLGTLVTTPDRAERPAEDVFDFLADLRNEKLWNPRVRQMNLAIELTRESSVIGAPVCAQ
jgi:hypothetical protein